MDFLEDTFGSENSNVKIFIVGVLITCYFENEVDFIQMCTLLVPWGVLDPYYKKAIQFVLKKDSSLYLPMLTSIGKKENVTCAFIIKCYTILCIFPTVYLYLGIYLILRKIKRFDSLSGILFWHKLLILSTSVLVFDETLKTTSLLYRWCRFEKEDEHEEYLLCVGRGVDKLIEGGPKYHT